MLTDAERSRRYRARRRGENVPRGKPGRKPKVDRFRAEFPEDFLGPLLGIDPQRLRDLESSVTSRGMTLAEFLGAKRAQLPYGLQPDDDEPAAAAPHDPIVEQLLGFDFGAAE